MLDETLERFQHAKERVRKMTRGSADYFDRVVTPADFISQLKVLIEESIELRQEIAACDYVMELFDENKIKEVN